MQRPAQRNAATGLDVGGTHLDYVDHGAGEPVILVHGSASDRRTWQQPLRALAERHRVIAYSRRYHWPNPPIERGADYPMAEHVDDLEGLFDALDLSPAHLVGHSYGAFVCLRLAIRAPRLVRSLTLIEPPVLPLVASDPPRPREVLRLLVTRPRTAMALIRFGARGVGPATAAVRRGDPDEALRRFAIAVLGREHFERLSPARLEQARTNFIEAELVGSGLGILDSEAVRGLTVPTLLITGGRSPRLFHRLADRLEQLIEGVQRINLPGASHIVHEDETAAFVEATLRFLRSASSAHRAS